MKINKLIAVPIAGLLALGTASLAGAQTTGPRVALEFATSGLTTPLVASSTDAVIARLILDTTGSTEPVSISSLPISLVVGGGGQASHLFNCTFVSETNPSVDLTASTTLAAGFNNMVFNTPLVLGANTITTLSLRCDVSANLVAGSSYSVSTNTANVVAVGANTGLPALITVRGAVVVPPPVVVPGIPSTGVKSPVMQSGLMLLASLSLATLGFSYLVKKPAGQKSKENS